MLTSYANCWASFLLRALSLTVFGSVMLTSGQTTARQVLPMLALVLITSGANAVSVGLRLRALSGLYGLLLLEGGLSAALGLIVLTRPHWPAASPLMLIAALAVLNGLVQFELAWRHRSAQHRAWPMTGIAALWLASAAVLAGQPLMGIGTWTAGIGVSSLLLGIALAGASLQLRSMRRHAQRELLRDAPLAPRTASRAAVGVGSAALHQAAARRPRAAHHAA